MEGSRGFVAAVSGSERKSPGLPTLKLHLLAAAAYRQASAGQGIFCTAQEMARKLNVSTWLLSSLTAGWRSTESSQEFRELPFKTVPTVNIADLHQLAIKTALEETGGDHKRMLELLGPDYQKVSQELERNQKVKQTRF